jgi:Phosphotransferase enzyme family
MTVKHPFDWTSWVLSQTRARALVETTLVQTLWGGYGELLRLSLAGGPVSSVILKKVAPPQGVEETISDRRKRRSYAVEQAWYTDAARCCDEDCRVAKCYGIEKAGDASFLLLEDLNSAGFYPVGEVSAAQTQAGLSWLAHFHARFLGVEPVGLWEQGTYWHLDTRQKEWEIMPSGCLKDQARALDSALQGARFQTLVHGDAKTPNFCWNSQGTAAAVDFQYIGGGCGIRDVALFLNRALGKSGCASEDTRWLDVYFGILRQALGREGHGLIAEDLEREWRSLFPVAWSDYRRFIQGWGGPAQLDPYSVRQLERALALL